jgi:hypothetical protein
MPVSTDTSTLVDWPAAIAKLFGSAELQPMNVQLDRFSE